MNFVVYHPSLNYYSPPASRSLSAPRSPLSPLSLLLRLSLLRDRRLGDRDRLLRSLDLDLSLLSAAGGSSALSSSLLLRVVPSPPPVSQTHLQLAKLTSLDYVNFFNTPLYFLH